MTVDKLKTVLSLQMDGLKEVCIQNEDGSLKVVKEVDEVELPYGGTVLVLK